MSYINGLKSFLDKSHSQFQSVENIKSILVENGFNELKEDEEFVLEQGKSYFVLRNLTSILAFKVPSYIKDLRFQVVAVHSDSPAFKIKENPCVFDNGYVKLKVEGYGGMIRSVWLDKPLSIAGRIVVDDGEKLVSRLIDIDKDLAIIPNVAIHFNREINKGYEYNPQVDLCPIIGQSETDEDLLLKELNKFVNKNEKILSHDLYLYNREKATLLGANEEFFVAPKLDDLACDYTALEGFIAAKPQDFVQVFVSFDNEEVGSESINGADSTFLESILKRITFALGKEKEDYFRAVASSFLISADNGHAVHPNHPELSDNKNLVKLNEGIVLKYNANMKYTSDALSSGVIKRLCKKENIKYQEFFNRSDMVGGSTLGNISISHVSMLSVDIGLAQLAMHSNYEVCGSKDVDDMIKLIKTFYETSIIVKESNVLFK